MFEWIGFDEDTSDGFVRFSDRLFDAVNCRFPLLNIEAGMKFDIHGQQDLIGSQLHRQQVAHILHGRIGSNDVADVGDSGAIRSLAHQQGAGLGPAGGPLR